MKLINFMREQITLIKSKDPAINSTLETILYPGFRAQLWYKLSHFLYMLMNLLFADELDL